MALLIPIEDAKRNLRVEHLDDDFDIQNKLEDATEIVIDYIKRPAHGWTADTLPRNVRAAILLTLSALYDDRAKAELLAALSGGDLSNSVVGLLYRLRDPALA